MLYLIPIFFQLLQGYNSATIVRTSDCTKLLVAWMAASPWTEVRRVAWPWLVLRALVVTPAGEVQCQSHPLMRLHQSHQFHSVSHLQLHLKSGKKNQAKFPFFFKQISQQFVKHHRLQNHFTSAENFRFNLRARTLLRN